MFAGRETYKEEIQKKSNTIFGINLQWWRLSRIKVKKKQLKKKSHGDFPLQILKLIRNEIENKDEDNKNGKLKNKKYKTSSLKKYY